MLDFLAKAKFYAIAAGAFLLAVLGALAAGFRRGEKSADNANAAAAAKVTSDAIAKSNAVNRTVDALQPERVDKELSKWSRD